MKQRMAINKTEDQTDRETERQTPRTTFYTAIARRNGLAFFRGLPQFLRNSVRTTALPHYTAAGGNSKKN